MKIIRAAIFAIVMVVPAQAAAERAEKIVKTEALACNSERQFDRAERIRKSGEPQALQAFTKGAVLSGSCVLLKPGASVFDVGRGKGAEVIKIRPKGSVVTFFTSETNFE
jgi:hypothetical protein